NVQRMKKPALRIRLRDDTKNTRAIGAVIEVKSGKLVQRRQVTCGNAYLGQDDEVVHVGLGSARTADVTITWPDGTKTTHDTLGVGAVHLLQKRG
ncbi:MAG TPA: ASPIC/UnbV domain-containing protein, partial [Nannocystaceae bacterium]|nr:ASPIC/UnbV domain-containing protein [Nannocystaceae bacterium]